MWHCRIVKYGGRRVRGQVYILNPVELDRVETRRVRVEYVRVPPNVVNMLVDVS